MSVWEAVRHLAARIVADCLSVCAFAMCVWEAVREFAAGSSRGRLRRTLMVMGIMGYDGDAGKW